MPIRKPKPTSPGVRFVSYPDFAEVTRSEPEKSLTEGLKKSGGRNAHGRKTSRHRGGGAKRLYRKIDFKRRKDGIPARVAHIEYDPNRSAYIALLHYADGEKAYILAPNRLRVGATVESGPNADIRVGNSLPLSNMPPGTIVHNVELTPGRGGQLARSAGTGVQLLAKDGVPAKVATIEYDPNRSCYIALVHYADGHKDYILAPAALKVGDAVKSGPEADIKPGHAMALGQMPTGTIVHNVELIPGQGGKMGRSAGTAIQLVAKEGEMVTLRLPSTEMRLVRAECRGSIGVLSNAEHQNMKIGKAGRSRHKGKRPQTRGVAMNPVDHPPGGGEAHHTPGGHPVTPWGKPTLGYRTRKKGKQSDRYIVRGRRRGKKKGGR